MLFKNHTLVAFVLFDYTTLLFEDLYHRTLLGLLYAKYLLKGDQIFILFLCKIDFKAWKFNAQDLLFNLFYLTIINIKIHILNQRKHSFFNIFLLQVKAFLHKRIISQKSRSNLHRIFLILLISITIYNKISEIETPALIFIQRCNKNRTIDTQLNI